MQICLLGSKAECFPHCSILLPLGPTAPDKIIWHTNASCSSFWEPAASPSPPHSPPRLHFSFCWMSGCIEEAAVNYLFWMLFGINILRGTDSAGSIPEPLGGAAVRALNLICQIDLWEMKTGCKRQTTLCALLCHSLALRARRKPNLLWRCWLFQALHKHRR